MKKNTRWKKIVERDTEALVVYQVAEGRKYYPETTDLNYRPYQIKYENKWYLIPTKELEEEYLSLKQRYRKDPDFLVELARKVVKDGEKLLDIAQRMSLDIKKKSGEELTEQFKQYNLTLEHFVPFIWITFSAERLLTETVNDQLKEIYFNFTKTERRKVFTTLTTPQKESNVKKEYRACLELAVLFKKYGEFTPKMERELKKLYKQYGWLGAVSIGWSHLRKLYTLEHYRELVADLARGDPKKELKKLQKQALEQERKYSEIIKRKEIDRKLIRNSELLQEYVFFHTLRGEYVVRALIFVKPLLAEIAAKCNIKLEDLVYLTPDEIIMLLNFKVRRNGYKVFIKRGKGSISLERERIAKKLEKVDVLRGNVVQPGFVKGKVKIVLDAKEINKIKKGDVLVAKMTSPGMILGIRKAVAIVTDEGGITCHAAIISREFKVPCIIATKIATKVLKDGDLVEVDAERGIVRKL